MRGVPFDPKDGLKSSLAGLDYEKPEVRDFMMSHIREYLEVYDFEGMELDWLRNPLCCNPPATQAAQDTMIRWLDFRAATNGSAGAPPRQAGPAWGSGFPPILAI